MVAAVAAMLASCGAGGKKNAEAAVANEPVIVRLAHTNPIRWAISCEWAMWHRKWNSN